jgi:hypothetical protein
MNPFPGLADNVNLISNSLRDLSVNKKGVPRTMRKSPIATSHFAGI